jgi:cysteine desulfuration protein SufE
MLTPEEVIDNFDFLETWDARYGYLVELGEALPPLEDAHRIDENRVQGCMSKVWVCPEPDPEREGALRFVGDCDTAIIKGVLALVIGLMSGRTPQEIAALDLDALLVRFTLFITPYREHRRRAPMGAANRTGRGGAIHVVHHTLPGASS